MFQIAIEDCSLASTTISMLKMERGKPMPNEEQSNLGCAELRDVFWVVSDKPAKRSLDVVFHFDGHLLF